MSSLIHIDYETYSPASIRDVGAYRYAADPDAKILIMAIAIDNSRPLVWRYDAMLLGPAQAEEAKAAVRLFEYGVENGLEFWAHNAQFEIAVTHYRAQKDMGVTKVPELSQWLCTAALARRLGLPSSLAQVAAVLGLQQKKDTTGKSLIRMFSIPDSKTGKPMESFDAPEDFQRFCDYCVQDVCTEQDIHRQLGKYKFVGHVRDMWELDKVVNHRGVPVNVAALQNASALIDTAKDDLIARFQKITGLMPTQRDKVLEWFRTRGYPFNDLQAQTVREALTINWVQDNTVLEALRIRASVSYAAVNKIKSMLDCECGDGIVRGTLLFHGAGTGRWSGRLIQTQNLKRPEIKDTAGVYDMVCSGATKQDIEMVYGNPIRAIASCIRHFVQRPDGPIYDADYSAIEARIVCWLAGQEDALQEYRDGVDAYVTMAAIIFNKHRSKVTDTERWVGKQTVLGCGFQMSANRFYEQCLDLTTKFDIKGLVMTPELASMSVEAFRRIRGKVVNLWHECETQAKRALLNPEKVFKVGQLLSYKYTTVDSLPVLTFKLPSGRSICYLRPKIESDGKLSYQGLASSATIMWQSISLYGGKLVENATQAVAADIMAHGAYNAEKQGFKILTLIHDQALAEYDGRPVGEFCAALTNLPNWANGLPIAAEGKVTPYYIK